MSQSTKKCTKCGTVKPITEFYRQASAKDGFTTQCKKCQAAYDKKYAEANADALRETRKAYRLKNKEKLREYRKEYDAKNSEKINKRAKIHYLKNRDRMLEKARKYRLAHPEKYIAYHREYAEKNKEKLREYRQSDHAKKIETAAKKRRREDPKYRLNANFSKAVWESMKGNKNGNRWEKMVGYSIKDLKLHLEKQFLDGMSWENYGKGGWHIDHRIPVRAFNFEKKDDLDFRRCWSLKNLQPMWETENLSKGGKLEAPFQPSLMFG
jgi:hypothetical protein